MTATASVGATKNKIMKATNLGVWISGTILEKEKNNNMKKNPKLKWTITWEIDMFEDDAKSPLKAAQEAFDWLKDDQSICHIFTVKDRISGKTYSVDLDEIGEEVIEIK